MTPRTFNIPIRIKPNAQIKGMYTGRTYTASEELDNALEVMAEKGVFNHYIFRQNRATYYVEMDDCEVLTTETPPQPADDPENWPLAPRERAETVQGRSID
jgi:hypothetical protein